MKVALLRAAGIPARYVYGTVQIPADQVMNWVGGAATPEMAANLLGQGGIPVTSLVSGGQVVAFKLEHVWVEAWVDFVPSRGVKNLEGDTWVPLDASFKQYDYVAPLANTVNVPDPQAFMDQWSALGTIDEANGAISGLDAADYRVIADPIINGSTALLETTAPEATIDQWFGAKSIRVSLRGGLAGSLPYHLVAATQRFSALPDTLRHRARIEVFNSALDLAADNPALSHTLSLPELNGRRLAIQYLPATDADAQVIQNAIDSGATTIPAYLVQMKAALQLDEQTVATGLPVGMGTDQIFRVTFTDPQNLNPNPVIFRGTVGDLGIFAIDAIGLEMGSIAARHRAYVHLDRTTGAVSLGLNRKTAQEGLHLTALSYWQQYTEFDRLLGRATGALALRLPSIGRFTHPLAVSYSFGIPRNAWYGSTQVDIPRIFLAVAAKDAGQRRGFIMSSGIYGSTMEGLVLDQVDSRPAGTAVSAVRLIALALAQGQKVVAVRPDNLEPQLAKTQVSETVKSDIRRGVGAGLQAIAHEAGLTHHGWSGSGYIIANTDTGEGAYRISEGLNGGGIFGPPTADVQNASSYAERGSAGGLLATSVLTQEGSVSINIGPAARAVLPMLRSAIGPLTIANSAKIMAYFAAVALAMHYALIEELTDFGAAPAEDSTDCKKSQSSACGCSVRVHARRPPYPEEGNTGYFAQYTRKHHACADQNTMNERSEVTVRLGNIKRSFDVYSLGKPTPEGAIAVADAGEVKTTGSLGDAPGPGAYGYFVTSLSNQIADQIAISVGCGFKYSLIVQEDWQVRIANTRLPGEPVIEVKKACPSIGPYPPPGKDWNFWNRIIYDGDPYLDTVE